MNTPPRWAPRARPGDTPGTRARTRAAHLLCGGLLLASVPALHGQTAASAPSQTPLLATSTGAKPNLMITLDNSGSMAFPYHETYGVTSDSKTSSGGGAWYAQRSAQVNPLYYDPRVTYLPRVGPNGAPLVPNDGIVFVSNQGSASFRYQVWRNNSNIAEIRSSHSSYAANPTTGTGWTSAYGALTSTNRTPVHITHTASNAATAPAFTYVRCNSVVTSGGLQTGCSSYTSTDIRPGNPASVPLPADHQRTDCGPSSCTNAQEIANILNWYRYHLFRAPAVATAIGQALASPEYNGKFRLGYTLINERNNTTVSANSKIPGATNQPMLLRSVRQHQLGSADTRQFYAWLYDQDGTQNRHSNRGTDGAFQSTANRVGAPFGGTPLHNAVDRVADYFKVASGVTQNPWATNPAAAASASNPELSCRRSFNLLFSDGAWNSGTATNAGANHDNTAGPTFYPGSATSGTGGFRYEPQGINTTAGRQLYTPFGGPATSGLADLTARYQWHEDLRPLSNDVPTRAGQPVFWQNMSTYTIGYLIRPSGEVPGATSGLTFGQIDAYRTQFPQVGYTASTKPSWATGDVNSSTLTDAKRIDDFIQAGFTGGGRGFSVRSADDIRQAFRSILSDIINATGRDAGVAVSSAGADNSTIAGKLKYSVTYKTLDNTGDVTAQEIDAQGNITGTRWQASQTIPAHNLRRVFAMSGQRSPVDFAGNFSTLPTDIRTSLQTGPDAARIPTDNRFVNYLRGLDPVLDANGKLFRQRAGKMGSMVNSPSIYMGADTDLAYDLATGTRVSGSEKYEAYVRAKAALPASLVVATNAGQVHSFQADNGAELAAFMPRRSMKRLLNAARENYEFQYVLDGPLSEHDIYDGSAWNHLAVGTGGRGEPLIYALRSPLNSTAAPPNRQPARTDFLWETGPELVNASDLAMGHISNPARSGQTRSGHWVVVLNSGHYNGRSDGSGHGLIVLDALTGDLIRRIPLPAGYPAGRGLGGVTLVRDEGKRIVAAYAGDARGQLWRFDLKGSPSQWAVSYGQPLFTAANNRPIYGAPAWQPSTRHGTGTVVVFATGLLLEEADKADVANPEAIYGIWDPTPIGENDAAGFAMRNNTDLLAQSVDAASATSGAGSAASNTFFKSTANEYDPAVHKGWRLTLSRAIGERSIDQIRNLGANVLIASTAIEPPSNTEAETCRPSSQPTNYLYALDAQSGAMPKRALDQNGDGRLDAYSVVELPAGGYTRNLALRVLDSRDRWSSLRREQTNTQADDGEGGQQTRCVPVSARVLGTESGSVTAGAVCETQGWSRTHYQLMRPPQ